MPVFTTGDVTARTLVRIEEARQAHALMDNIVPDFPLCNKSFNQSYSGNDL